MGPQRDIKRMYRFFRCTKCDKTWESSHVYCRTDTHEAEFGQEYKVCRVMCMPHRVQPLVYSRCLKEKCNCIKIRDSDSDPNKAHRSDLCAKCRAGFQCMWYQRRQRIQMRTKRSKYVS